MAIFSALATLLIGAALCFGLSRALPTRLVGLLAALLCAVAGGLVLAGVATEPVAPLELLLLGEARFSVSPALGAGDAGLAAALLLGGGVSLLALAGAVAGGLRGFGALFGWALLALAGALLSLAAPPLSLLQPLGWAVLTIAGYGALRASGAEEVAEAPPLGLAAGLLASALLTTALLAGAGPLAGDALPGGLTAAVGLLAALALAGAAPLLSAREEAVAGPAPLGALIYGVVAPAAGLGWLLRAAAALPVLPTSWAVLLGLLGALGALGCAAGALGERRLRPLLAWSAGAQASLVVAAAGLAGPLGALAGPALLASMMLATSLCAAAALSFERATGDDDYTAAQAPAPRLTAACWALGAAASLGLPPLLGFWGRLWLLEAAAEQQPWLIAPLLMGAALLLLALLAPAAGLWGLARGAERGRAGWGDWLPAALALLPLALFGAAPGLAWELWLRAVAFAPPASPVEPLAHGLLLAAGGALLVGGALLARARPARTLPRSPGEDEARLAPDALGAAVRPLAWLGNPRPLLERLWALLERASNGLRLVVGLFEQRYYLLGVLAALITIMLLMAQ